MPFPWDEKESGLAVPTSIRPLWFSLSGVSFQTPVSPNLVGRIKEDSGGHPQFPRQELLLHLFHPSPFTLPQVPLGAAIAEHPGTSGIGVDQDQDGQA